MLPVEDPHRLGGQHTVGGNHVQAGPHHLRVEPRDVLVDRVTEREALHEHVFGLAAIARPLSPTAEPS